MMTKDYTEQFTNCFSTDREKDEFVYLQEIDKSCREYNLKWKLLNDTMFIYSSVGTWHFSIYPSPYILLYHKNVRICNAKDYIGSNFHRQKIELIDAYATIEYIHRHDSRLLQRDNYRFENSSMNRSFKQIKK